MLNSKLAIRERARAQDPQKHINLKWFEALKTQTQNGYMYCNAVDCVISKQFESFYDLFYEKTIASPHIPM